MSQVSLMTTLNVSQWQAGPLRVFCSKNSLTTFTLNIHFHNDICIAKKRHAELLFGRMYKLSFELSVWATTKPEVSNIKYDCMIYHGLCMRQMSEAGEQQFFRDQQANSVPFNSPFLRGGAKKNTCNQNKAKSCGCLGKKENPLAHQLTKI